MDGHVRIQILLRLGSVRAQLTRKRSGWQVTVSNVFRQARRRFATHVAQGTLVIEYVGSHMIAQDSFGRIKFIAV